MPIWFDQLDDLVLEDGSMPISGVNNTLPPSVIDKNLAALAINRLSALDNLNRPRPGVITKFSAGSNFDSVHHLGNGVFLYNNAATWGKYDSRSGVNTSGLAGGPAFATGDQVYSALCDQVLYFSRGHTLYKYDPSVPGFGTNPIPFQWPDASFPIWASQRLIYANTNTLVVSDILAPESWHPATQEVTLDPIASDLITGQVVWQNQTLAVFRNGSTWVISTGPNLDVPNWEVNRTSATIGCCAHGTIVQCGVDVFFLSETGRGVYALSQMPSSYQLGVWTPISVPVKQYIDRINWTAVKNARATYWADLYILSVPLDGSAQNNYMLIYSVTLNAWQGRWCFESGGVDLGFRDSARDRTNPDSTVLLVGTTDGKVSQFTYPTDRRYYDTDLSAVQTPIESTLLTRSFTFNPSIAQIQPYAGVLQFLESEEDVEITVVVDRASNPLITSTVTSGTFLSLPIAQVPFDLDISGYYNFSFSLLPVGICDELQLQLDGIGNWTLFQIKLMAWDAAPPIAI